MDNIWNADITKHNIGFDWLLYFCNALNIKNNTETFNYRLFIFLILNRKTYINHVN